MDYKQALEQKIVTSSMYGEMKNSDIKKALNKCYGANYNIEPFVKNYLKLMLLKYCEEGVK